MKVSVVIPFYNEEKYIGKLVRKVLSRPEVDEIIAVDDGSTDSSGEILRSIAAINKVLKVIRKEKNLGKGSAIRESLKYLTGDIVIIQDADLEYNPDDYPALLAPFRDSKVEVVYGSRIKGKGNKMSYITFIIGGLLLTLLTNLLYNARISDEPTGYKVFRTPVLKNIGLRSQGFEFCPEVTSKILRKHIKIHEIPISYSPRKIYQGKKIKFRDGLIAIWTLLRYRLAH